MVALAAIAASYAGRPAAAGSKSAWSLSAHNSLLNPRSAATAETHAAVEFLTGMLQIQHACRLRLDAGEHVFVFCYSSPWQPCHRAGGFFITDIAPLRDYCRVS